MTNSSAPDYEGSITASGNASANASNIYVDESNSGLSNCVGTGTLSCTQENASNSNPAYFYTYSTQAPLNSWDFNNTWATVSGTYPTLRDINAFNQSLNLPNNGNLNNDGNNNAYEDNVSDFVDSNSNWSSVTIPSGDGCIIGSGQAENATSVKALSGYRATTNLDGFDIYCSSVGQTVPVTVIFPGYYPNALAEYYNASSNSYQSIPGLTYSTVTVNGVQKTEVTYDITDGGLLDEDGTANGVIVDPIGLYTPVVLASATSPDTGFGQPSSNTSPVLIVSLLLSIVSISYCIRRYIKI
jgi:hypothetical protein